jgi:murein DD-endopeptidase MepM/ murein hydrolase activator NlpD
MVSRKKEVGIKSKIRGWSRDLAIVVIVAGIAIAALKLKDGRFFDVPVPAALTAIPHVYGYNAATVSLTEGRIEEGSNLGDILQSNGVSYTDVLELEKASVETFDVRSIRAGKPYTVVHDTCFDVCRAFIYEPSPFYYITCSFDEEGVCVQRIDRPVTTELESAGGRIETSLWNAMMDQDLSPGIIDLMEDALASAVDFHHTQVGDEFKLIYEKKYIEGMAVSLGKVVGAYWRNAEGEFYSIYFDSDKYEGYFDEEGRPTKSAFLRSPVKFSRISSRYNLRRLHPIKKRRIPHRGTDYAAAKGTPIRATASGVVTKAAYTRNNGKYVKLKHDDIYQTQYLHMQRFAKGIRPGVRVQQGQTIGYVGSTGMATGPHVCYRFWKYGKQVDPLRENFPPADPMPEEMLPTFYGVRDSVKVQLDLIDLPPSTILASSLGVSTS